MSELKFNIGENVQKIKGYKFPGIVIGTALKRDGRRLWLVECTAQGASGMCHIFGDNDLEVSTELCEDEGCPQHGIPHVCISPPAQRNNSTFGLSITERSVVKRICSLGSNKAIAHEMGLSEATVKVHVKTILHKLDLQSRTLLAAWAVRNGLDQ